MLHSTRLLFSRAVRRRIVNVFPMRHLHTPVTSAPSIRELLRSTPSTSPSPSTTTTIEVTGWVRSVRAQKQYSFMQVNDGSCVTNLQVMWPAGSAHIALASDSTSSSSSSSSSSTTPLLTTGAAVRVKGTLQPSPKPGQPVELIAASIIVLGTADSAHYPLQKKETSREYLRDIAHLRGRGNLGAATLRVRSTLSFAIHDFFRKKGFALVNTPILTSNDCEGAGELFSVLPASELKAGGGGGSGGGSGSGSGGWKAKGPPLGSGFFGKPVYLTVSGQLHLEAFACAMGKVYTFGPTFRAEDSNTPRHLAEFWMVEPEVAPGTIQDAIALAEGCVRHAYSYLQEHGEEDVAFFNERVDKNTKARLLAAATGPSFARMTYTEAIDILQKSGRAWKVSPSSSAPVWGEGLGLEHERYLAEEVVKGPVFVTHYPEKIKPFYMRRADDSNTNAPGPTVEAFDLLVPGVGELAGGSAREERYLPLAQKMRERKLLSSKVEGLIMNTADGGMASGPADLGMDGGNGGGGAEGASSSPSSSPSSPLDWYLDLRKYGSLPHAGWGMGFERLVLFATGLDNVRDAIPVPRVPGSCRM